MYFWQQSKILTQLQRLPRQRLVQLTEVLQGKAMGVTEPAAATTAWQHLQRRPDASMQAQTEGLGQEDTMLGLKQAHVHPNLFSHHRRDFDLSMQAHADGLGHHDTMFAAHARAMSTASEQQAPSVRKTNGNGNEMKGGAQVIEQLLSPDAPEDVLKRATDRLNQQEKMHLRQLVMKAMA
ncbi:uncharacterized protein LOC118428051 [Branchiostoma floridae]|uniref:Uncharacterized protein LOC118428051 n=1 Tax=Branchiostoma floridae TaxID=7739 RepID=A0A9J7N5E1_BRAFL|nr:uncharacterized protein LOC118428051 [Branchiostoma floridae]XP_035693917.1 uncharacterized protein LOC118428051 [Branchiostoma floridae]XP_035693924.1 uncharacterized protein LOC118428051 [Branchiostoma floridae]XP_035693933.1 uncharacterized protein LOC118428051 [Branchiostoma floridae]XP_035693940.1 uncharacterized protein LOC118428051 [Branchiostoma floridae]XP_035693947.1 uncharacterized protein LOC118428051 [Branchiostoma floridae]